MRTISQLGTSRVMVSAIVTSSGFGVPKLRPSRAVRDHRIEHLRDGCGRRSSGPTSRRSRCSGCRRRRSGTRLPRAATKNGSPPTDLNARTGELTPPGISAWARVNRSCERLGVHAVGRSRERRVNRSRRDRRAPRRPGSGASNTPLITAIRSAPAATSDRRILGGDAADRHSRQAERCAPAAAGPASHGAHAAWSATGRTHRRRCSRRRQRPRRVRARGRRSRTRR